ncbi:HDOD domain-containing protein [Methylophaga pinxianii]|uniref:HDOD domain-containing protein n=1 Tax=Methylophaga pinxianii TaxID=2881052 RepID=UPI001CF5C30C|nr:HDOD domain-containing protein [Methylophaga pinxianii]MCB2427490.1 HDOD domain-containing protein [Methylophaga pinxianii]UPH44771.1 HDOD domain-containing protein [Methylophaga pinxianii]
MTVEQQAADIQHLFAVQNVDYPQKPQVLGRLSYLQQNPHNSMDDVLEIVAMYPNLEQRIIALANSPRFRGIVTIETLKPAILRLGMSQVLTIMTGMILLDYFEKNKTPLLEKYFKNMRTRSLYVSALSYVLAYEKTKVDPEQAMLAGIIHNVGVLPLLLRLAQLPELYYNPKAMDAVAKVIIPRTYPLAGRILLTDWQMEPHFIEVASGHQNLQHHISDEIDLIDIVVVARQLSAIDSFDEETVLPSALLESRIFNKFWQDEEQAVTELAVWQEKIKLYRQNMQIST